MCLATPLKVIEVNGTNALVEGGEHTHQVDISLLKGVRPGDYIIANKDLAINKIPAEEAEKIFAMMEDINNKKK